MKSALFLCAFALAIFALGCSNHHKSTSSPRYQSYVTEEMTVASPTPRPSATPGPFDKRVDPTGMPTSPGSN